MPPISKNDDQKSLLILFVSLGLAYQNRELCRERLDFTAEWRFALNSDSDFSAPEADDSD